MNSDVAIEQIPLDKIICGKQVREHFDEQAMAGLTQSMRENGMHEPVHVLQFGEMYTLITGGRRVRAARRAGWTVIRAIVEQGELGKTDLLVRQILENIQRQNITPLETAKAMKFLIEDAKWSAKQTAALFSTSSSTVTRMMALLELPEELQKKFEGKELTLSAAYSLSQIEDAQEQIALGNQIINEQRTRDDVERTVKAKRKPGRAKKPSSTLPSCITAKLGDGRSVVVRSRNLTLASLIDALTVLLNRARDAEKRGFLLDTFLKMLRDTSGKGDSESQAA